MADRENGKGIDTSLDDDIKIGYAEKKAEPAPVVRARTVPDRKNTTAVLVVIIAVVILIAFAAVVLLLVDRGGDATNLETAPVDTSIGQDTTSSDQTDDTTTPPIDLSVGLSVVSVTESGDKVLVETSLGTVAFPYAFSDVIAAEAVNDYTGSYLVFTADCGGKSERIYSLAFNSDTGSPVGTLDIEGESIGVSVVFYDSELKGDGLTTFKATQETFNEVYSSLITWPEFAIVG